MFIYYALMISVTIVMACATASYVYIQHRKLELTSEMVLAFTMCVTRYIEIEAQNVQPKRTTNPVQPGSLPL